MDKMGGKSSFLVSLMLYLGSCFIISRYIAPNHLQHEFYVPVLTYFDLLLSFVIGALFLRLKSVKSNCYLGDHPCITKMLLMLLFCSHFVTSFQGINPFYQAVIIYLFLHIPHGKYISTVLESLGKQSMFMWMTHTYFAFYLFHDFIYGFQYPILIYLILILISYIVSLLFSFIVKI